MVKTKDCGIRIGDTIKVKIDRPIGTVHPKHDDIIYPINYGYVEGIIAQDGEEQDVYILGCQKPLDTFTGRIIGVVRRSDDNEDKFVAAPQGMCFTAEQIRKEIHFVEKYFESSISSIFDGA